MSIKIEIEESDSKKLFPWKVEGRQPCPRPDALGEIRKYPLTGRVSENLGERLYEIAAWTMLAVAVHFGSRI